jgi:Flp pilus assembly protein TadD
MDDRDPLLEAAWRLDAGYPAEALATLRDADPLNARVASLRGRALLEVGRPAEAEEEARRGLALDPDNLFMLELLASVQMARDAGAAEETIRRALALDAGNPRLLALQVVILLRQDRFEAAEYVLARLMSVAPEEEATRRVRTVFLMHASQSTEAMSAARDLLHEFPDDAYAHYLQGLVLLNGRWWRAFRHLREAAALRPQDPLLVETARTMKTWYAWPVYLTSGVMHWVIAAVLLAVASYFLVLDDNRVWYVLLGGLALTGYKWLVHFAMQAKLQRRVTRALREMHE